MHCDYYFRTNIETVYGQQVAQIRKQYTQEDKELIKEVLEAKASSSQKPDTSAHAQKIAVKEVLESVRDLEAIFGKPTPSLTHSYVHD